MPRKARIVIPKIAHHVTQRGNRRQDVFEEKEDFASYCYLVNEYSRKYDVDILAYCLMNNHVHMVAVPKKEESFSKFFRAVHMRYAQYYNFTRKTSGHLWQGRFFSCVLDDRHLLCAIRYVEQNPVRAGMTEEPWDYQWSSAKWHIGQASERYIALKKAVSMDSGEWKEYLSDNDVVINEMVRKRTQKGLALADETFIQYWESKAKCLLSERKAGRPKRK